MKPNDSQLGFDFSSPAPAKYPDAPASRRTDTSRQAAEAIAGRAELLRHRVYNLLRGKAMTADECAAQLRESVLAVRPRVTELNKQERIVDTGERRKNRSGRNAIVWRAK